jgi:hypothetical protein
LGFYRCYLIDSSGLKSKFWNFVAQNDTEAWVLARHVQYVHAWRKIELWEQFRQVEVP